MPRVSLAHALAHCQPGQIVAALADGLEVAVAVSGSGRLVVVADRCPHQYAPISEGYLDGENIVCPRHNWEFCLADGKVVVPSARRGCNGLEVLTVTPDGLLDPQPRSR